MADINNNEDNLWLSLVEREELLPQKKELTNEEKLVNVQKHVRALVIAICEKELVIDKDKNKDKYINNMTEAVMNTLCQEMLENDNLDIMNVVSAEQKYINLFIKKILYKIINKSNNLSKEIEEKEKKNTRMKKKERSKKALINSNINVFNGISDLVQNSDDINKKYFFLERVLDSFGEAYIEIDSNGKINKANQALYTILGVDTLIDCQLSDLVFDKDELQDILNNYDKNNSNIIIFRHKNNTKKWLQIKISKSTYNNNDLVFLTDVTNFINAINFPMTNPNIVVAFSDKAHLIPFKINGYDDDIFPGFKKILDDLGEKSPEVLFPPDLKQITLDLANKPESKIVKTVHYTKNGFDKYFRWKFHYDKLSDVIRAYAEDVTEEENLRRENEKINSNTFNVMAKMEGSGSLVIGKHIKVVKGVALAFAKKLKEHGVKFSLEGEELARAVALHDIGKPDVPQMILDKPSVLTPEEFYYVKKHPTLGAKRLSEISTTSPVWGVATDIAWFHHENWDGKGYPNNLKGEDIPTEARLTSIVDVFDALLSADRSYKKAKSVNKVKEIILEGRGTKFDPSMVDVFIKNYDFFVRTRNQIIFDHEAEKEEKEELDAIAKEEERRSGKMPDKKTLLNRQAHKDLLECSNKLEELMIQFNGEERND